LGTGALAAGHRQPGCKVHRNAARLNGCGGFGQFRKQQSATRCGDVLSAVGCGPHHGSVVELPFSPTTLAAPKGFQQVVSSAQTFQVGSRGRPVRPRDRMVDVAIRRGHFAAREATCHVAAADEVGQLLGRSVSGFRWGLAGVDDWGDGGPDRGPAGDRPWQKLPTHEGGGPQAGQAPRSRSEGFGERQLAQRLGEHGWRFTVEGAALVGRGGGDVLARLSVWRSAIRAVGAVVRRV